jgi:hypothetical protein
MVRRTILGKEKKIKRLSKSIIFKTYFGKDIFCMPADDENKA